MFGGYVSASGHVGSGKGGFGGSKVRTKGK